MLCWGTGIAPSLGLGWCPWVPMLGQAWRHLEPPPPPKRSLGAPSHPFLHVAFIPQCLWRVSGVGSPEGGAWMCPRALPCRDSRTYAEDTGVNKD